jgi:hypothetical protein
VCNIPKVAMLRNERYLEILLDNTQLLDILFFRIIVSQRSDAEIQDWIFSKLDLTNANYRQLAEDLLRLRQSLIRSSAFQVRKPANS